MKKSEKQENRLVFVDPPSGWRYGFPDLWDKDKMTLEELLDLHEYPKKDQKFAMEHLRMWNFNEDDK